MRNRTSSAHLTLLAITLTATLCLSTAQADLAFSNGLPNSLTGGWMTQWLRAEDFTLAQDTMLTDVRFWSRRDNFLEGFTWILYNDGSATDEYGNTFAAPGTQITSGTATLETTPYTVTYTAPAGVYQDDDYQVDFSLGSGVALESGTYWLGLHNGPLKDTDEPVDSDGNRNGPSWVSMILNTATITGSRLWDLQATEGNWERASNPCDYAFEVYGEPCTVPVPGAALLCSLGLGLAGWMKRRQRA